jgi:N-methylhydantoinase B
VLDYRVTAEEVYLTYATTRSARPPWPLSGGQPGSLNGVSVHRHDGAVERYDMCTRVRVVKGELIRLTTATGGGYGNPADRGRAEIRRDLKNEFVTSKQAETDYGFTAR